MKRLIPLIAVALIGCGGDTTEPAGDFQATEADVRAFVLADAGEDSDPKVFCTLRENCGVTFTIEELVGIDADRELLDEQRDLWAALFSDPEFRAGTVTLRAPVTTVGGKAQTGEVLSVHCERSAARKVDWEAVDPEGIKQLCDWQELVSF